MAGLRVGNCIMNSTFGGLQENAVLSCGEDEKISTAETGVGRLGLKWLEIQMGPFMFRKKPLGIALPVSSVISISAMPSMTSIKPYVFASGGDDGKFIFWTSP